MSNILTHISDQTPQFLDFPKSDYCSNLFKRMELRENPISYTDPFGLAKSDIVLADTVSFAIGGPVGYLVNKGLQILNFEVRDSLNQEPPEDPIDDTENWKRVLPPKDVFHQPESGELVYKYTSLGDGGHNETCWIQVEDGPNVPLEDPNTKATYNLGGDGGDSLLKNIEHAVPDIGLWVLYGADRNDTSTIVDRIVKSIDGAKGLGNDEESKNCE